MTKIDIAVIEELVRAFGRARKKCPSITGVRLWGDGFEQVIRVDSDGNDGEGPAEEVELVFPDNRSLLE